MEKRKEVADLEKKLEAAIKAEKDEVQTKSSNIARARRE